VRQRSQSAASNAPAPTIKRAAPALVAAPNKPKKRKLTYKETGELASLPDRIDSLEREREQLYASLADPIFLRDGSAVASAKARLASLDTELSELVARWEELETIAADS
jgi:ATP-binding cassette subfamily F protein uup